MKTSLLKYFSLIVFIVLMIACSTKKDKWVNREFQALNTKYNVLYHGNVALEKGVEELKLQYKDNFWERLPIERMTVSKENRMPGDAKKNANFERAEEKATKAIQKRSMNIEGKERNPQMDEAHLLLGKARYYDQRFVPALEAFNYVLYKYPESDKIYEVKIWREKTNMRMENDALAVTNLRRLLKEIKFKDQIFADANATLAQAFLNLQEKDSAVAKLRLATKFTKSDEEKARYRFILGQVFDDLGQKDSSFVAYQSVIDMKRKSPRRYVIQAHIQQAKQFNYKTGDTLAFVEKYKELLEDRENRPYLDFINHQVALFYDGQNNDNQAKKYYNASLKLKSEDQYLGASNYRNLADIYFDNAKYPTAGKYYDSTLVKLDPRTREHKFIKKKRENLEDVIKYEAIAQKNDSILNLVALSENGRRQYFEDYIAKLKIADEKATAEEKKRQEIAERLGNSSGNNVAPRDSKNSNNPGNKEESRSPIAPPDQNLGPRPTNASATFYFYNPTTVAYGKNEFRKKWGQRALQDNWRLSAGQSKTVEEVEDEEAVADNKDPNQKETEKAIEPKYTPEFYISQLPKEQKEIDELVKDRNFAYYQLGLIYKEKFKEYQLAANKLEQLLKNNPEERLVLPSMYHLYKIYEIIDKSKALAMKDQIISKYPESRYAQILNSSNPSETALSQSPEVIYKNLYAKYEQGDLFTVLEESEALIDQFTGEEIVSKFELLKAHTVGKLKGLEEYKKALNFVALNYPNSSEGKDAEQLLAKSIPYLEKLRFDGEPAKNWNIIYKITNIDDPKTKVLIDKIKKFTAERTAQKLTYSVDIYTMDEKFLVIHGIPSEINANDINTILKDYKDYKITEPSIVISSENYKIVQIKKNLEEYLKPRPKIEPAPATPEPVVPVEEEKPNNKDKAKERAKARERQKEEQGSMRPPSSEDENEDDKTKQKEENKRPSQLKNQSQPKQTPYLQPSSKPQEETKKP
ncbi:type IX secretion system periplasmic lipoprotein PorW/SprE [Flavobacterium arsenatis]|uniref:type IX secretion system periplasmic lipoprotein PorW/SprE n=1 Tax=Flavobacterium arsenatis TaxID=1484332 RepID=UPI00286D0D7E|nr:tetratricopeptide repeat protein [Flavobacterium arsenatis]